MMTRQEKNVFDLVVSGHSSKEIAKRLLISVHTVDTHRKNLRLKLGVHNTPAMIVKVYEMASQEKQLV